MGTSTRLFVGNLPENTAEDDLLSSFSAFGEITKLDLKSKSGAENGNKKFAFINLSASNVNVESCIQHFSYEEFKGHKLYVTRARESFLERLQREREQALHKGNEQQDAHEEKPQKDPVIKLSDKLNPRKRKIDNIPTHDHHQRPDVQANNYQQNTKIQAAKVKVIENNKQGYSPAGDVTQDKSFDKKKSEAERKRIESMKKKRQEFKEKQNIIRTGLHGVDKVQNRKIKFDDADMPMEVDTPTMKVQKQKQNNTLFDDNADDSDEGPNFEVKQQFEGKKGQKVLDLQSRYKSDKRFTLDERFIENEEEGDEQQSNEQEEVELGAADEKAKQLNILQDVLGVTLKTKVTESDNKKTKPKLGMFRFDPLQPDHAKFLAPVEEKIEQTKKSKKKGKEKQEEVKATLPEVDGPKVEVSKDQFYKVSDTLKEAIAQPTTFSLRTLFGNNENVEGPTKQDTEYIPLDTSKNKKKVKNPLEPSEKNPFVYDSSDSETEEPEKPEKETKVELPPPTETKAVWKENLFFTKSDTRLKDGLAFFLNCSENEVQKERRQLKSLVKKRIYNNDRKNQMFKKKIGGRKKSMKKPYKSKG